MRRSPPEDYESELPGPPELASSAALPDAPSPGAAPPSAFSPFALPGDLSASAIAHASQTDPLGYFPSWPLQREHREVMFGSCR